MKTETFAGEIKAYQGRTDWSGVTFPMTYSGSVEVFTDKEEAVAAGKWPNDNVILADFVNDKLRTAAKAQKYQDKIADLKTQYENSADFKRKNLIDAAVKAGFSVAEAEALAASKLGQ